MTRWYLDGRQICILDRHDWIPRSENESGRGGPSAIHRLSRSTSAAKRRDTEAGPTSDFRGRHAWADGDAMMVQ